MPRTIFASKKAFFSAIICLAVIPANTQAANPAVRTPCLQQDPSGIFCGEVNFTLIDAKTDKAVSGYDPIPANAVLNLKQLPDELTIRVNIGNANAGSVVLGFDGNPAYRVENSAPYALSQNSATDFTPHALIEGKHSLTATVYKGANGTGLQGKSATLNFTVLDAFRAVESLSLMDADNDLPIDGKEILPEQVTVDLRTSTAKTFNLRANTGGPVPVASVVFTVNGVVTSIQNSAPYSLAGDEQGNYRPWEVALGTHNVVATPYSNSNGKGIAGTPKTVSIQFIRSEAPKPVVFNPEALRALHYGPARDVAKPEGAVEIPAGSTIQNVLNKYAAGTVFYLRAGVYSKQRLTLEPGDVLVGEYGAVLDGGKTAEAPAIKGGAGGAIRNLEIRNYVHDLTAAVFTEDDMIIENNYIHHNSGSNLRLGTNSVLRFNKITHGGRYGLVGSGIADGVVVYNEVAYNNTRNLDTNWAAGGSKFAAHGTGNEIRRNWFHHNIGQGIWFDGFNKGIIIAGNLVENNTGNGIMDELNDGTKIQNNVVLNNKKTGIMVSSSLNAVVSNNILKANGSGFSLKIACRGFGNFVNNVFAGNTVHQNKTSTSFPNGKAAWFEINKGNATTPPVSQCPDHVGGTVYDMNHNRGMRFINNTYILGTGADFHFEGKHLTLPQWKAAGFDN